MRVPFCTAESSISFLLVQELGLPSELVLAPVSEIVAEELVLEVVLVVGILRLMLCRRFRCPFQSKIALWS